MLVLIGLVAAVVVTAIAVLVPWLPEQASDERKNIDFVFWFTTAICIAIFAVVAAVTVYAGIKFRAAPDDDSDGPPIHGHTGLEIVWTAVPTVLVTAIAIVSSVALARNDTAKAGQEPLKVLARGQQFAWTFTYPEQGALPEDKAERQALCLEPETRRVTSSPVLRLPLDRSVELLLCAREVIHSFWVPEFGQKQDAVPGIETQLTITPIKLGEFRVICTELCGLGHAAMRTKAVVMQQAAFERWLRSGGRESSSGDGENGGEALFAELGCGSCHALEAANTTGTSGPNLDNLPQLARRAGQPLEAFVRESIVNPGAYEEPGFEVEMPPFQLPEQELDALVSFLVASTRGGGA